MAPTLEAETRFIASPSCPTTHLVASLTACYVPAGQPSAAAPVQEGSREPAPESEALAISSARAQKNHMTRLTGLTGGPRKYVSAVALCMLVAVKLGYQEKLVDYQLMNR